MPQYGGLLIPTASAICRVQPVNRMILILALSGSGAYRLLYSYHFTTNDFGVPLSAIAHVAPSSRLHTDPCVFSCAVRSLHNPYAASPPDDPSTSAPLSTHEDPGQQPCPPLWGSLRVSSHSWCRTFRSTADSTISRTRPSSGISRYSLTIPAHQGRLLAPLPSRILTSMSTVAEPQHSRRKVQPRHVRRRHYFPSPESLPQQRGVLPLCNAGMDD